MKRITLTPTEALTILARHAEEVLKDIRPEDTGWYYQLRGAIDNAYATLRKKP